MAEGERRSAKLSKQPEIDQDEDYPVSTVKTLVTKPGGDVCAPTVLSASLQKTAVEDTPPPTKPPCTRNKTLTRTPALEGTSPPPEQNLSQLRINGGPGGPETNPTNTTLPNGEPPCQRGGSSNEAKNFLLSSHEQGVSNDSGRGTFEFTDCTSEKSLSRTSSTETSSTSHTPSGSDPYKDSSGIDLIDFFKQTLQKSPKDKKTLFALEKELHSFVRDDTCRSKKLHEMNPYDRMLVHRLAAHMGMEHNVDQPGKSVIIGKTEFTRIPESSLNDYFKELENDGQQGKKKILLKKPAHSLDERQCRGRSSLSDMRAKSLEERKENYFKTRERIFADGQQNFDGSPTQTLLPAPPFTSVMMQNNTLRPNLATASRSHHFKSADSVEPRHHQHGAQHLTTQHRRANMAKSNSYAGSPHQPIPANPPCTNLHNTLPDGAVYTSPPPLMANQIPGTPQGMAEQATTPPTPQSVQPHMNGDGSEYKFDPTNPPPFMVAAQTPAPPPVVSTPPHHTHLLHTSEASVSPMSQPMLAGMPPGVADYPLGQAVSIVPTMVQQQVYPSPSQQHLQGQYLPASPGPGCQQSVRLIAINQGAPTPVEPQSQTTVPMPALQTFAPLVSSPPLPHYHQAMAAMTPSQPDEMAAAAAYAQIPAVDGILNGGAAHFLQGYSLTHQPAAFPTQPAQYIIQQHQGASGQSYGAPQTTYYALPPSSTPPPLLTQPPPTHHQPLPSHLQQPANPHCVTQQPAAATPLQPPANATQMTSQMYSVLQSPPSGTTLTYPQMTPHHPQASGTKTWPPGILGHPSFRPPSPPAQQMTISYMAPPPAQSQPGTQFVALQPTGAPHQQPLRALIQLGTAPAGAALMRPRMPSSQVPHSQQSQHKYKVNGKHKKGKKTTPSEEEPNSPGVTMVNPLIPGLNGGNSFIPPVSSNRQ